MNGMTRGMSGWVIADRKGYAASMPIDVLPGSSGLAIELEAAASLRGSVVLPQGIEPRSVRVGVEFPHATRCATADTAVQADGSFFVEEIAPDTGHVVFFPSRGRELARIPDVNFISGEENRDPRLQSLELCRGWRELSLRLLDPSGKALGACDLELLLAGDRRGYPLRTDLDGQVGEWFPPEASHFELRVRGYRSLSFEWVQRTMELQLRAGIRVVLPIEAPKVEPIARLKVALAASNGARTAQVDVIDGLAEFVVSEPGTYEVQPAFVILQDSAMLVNGFQLEPRVHVEVGEGDQQRLPVCRIDEAALRAALKAR